MSKKVVTTESKSKKVFLTPSVKKNKQGVDAVFKSELTGSIRRFVEAHRTALIGNESNNPSDSQRSLKTRASKQFNDAFDEIFKETGVQQRIVNISAGDSTQYATLSPAFATSIMNSKTTAAEGQCVVISSNNSKHPRHYFSEQEKSLLPIRTDAQPWVSASMAYLALIAEGDQPPADSLVACSHLCHNNRCLKASHLAWEPQQNNLAREQCRVSKVCKCNQEPKCFPTQ